MFRRAVARSNAADAAAIAVDIAASCAALPRLQIRHMPHAADAAATPPLRYAVIRRWLLRCRRC